MDPPPKTAGLVGGTQPEVLLLQRFAGCSALAQLLVNLVQLENQLRWIGERGLILQLEKTLSQSFYFPGPESAQTRERSLPPKN